MSRPYTHSPLHHPLRSIPTLIALIHMLQCDPAALVDGQNQLAASSSGTVHPSAQYLCINVIKTQAAIHNGRETKTCRAEVPKETELRETESGKYSGIGGSFGLLAHLHTIKIILKLRPSKALNNAHSTQNPAFMRTQLLNTHFLTSC